MHYLSLVIELKFKTLSVFTPILSFNVLIFEICFAVSFINLSAVLVLKQTVNSSFFLTIKLFSTVNNFILRY